ncbi:TonB-linked SusC/RagA family outer membrane protein [Pedobacter africanus]|uniref:TonB-linked SusC/RagA family outer membrane protein n=1 Tax=Pedobacter africanus TaxID=151894 RepID=A0ACC6KX64_9SPHI|nr:TonB-dependent receptor [Pedobacter africanus]MDR6783939.1 TonB-linked SusC/RagA family outer membrane protein [Pedobacter africanus]
MLKIYFNTKSPWQIPKWGLLLVVLLAALVPGQVFAQDLKTIKGAVVEASNGQPIPGVSVKIKGSTKAVSTSNQGQYSIQAKSTDVLVFTFVGSKTQELTVGTRTTISVRLEADEQSLNETVIIGYGSAKKKDLTGAVGVVNLKDLNQAPVGTFAEALAGRVAGVQVAASDGQPGGGINIVIRGVGSLTQSTAPLFVIDGFPVEDLDPATINPDDIESMTILKDASSTAIYGARGSNGVVVITTKRGKIGKPVFGFNTSYGVQLEPKPIEVMSPYEFVKYQNELNPTQASVRAYFAYDPVLGRNKTPEDYIGVKGVDFQDLAIQTGLISKNNLSLRGGTEQTKYSVSGSFFDQRGVIIKTGYNSYNGNLKLDQTISKRFTAGLTVNYSGVKQNGKILNQGSVGASNPTGFILPRAWMYRPISAFIEQDLVEEDADDLAVTASDIRINPIRDLENQHEVNLTNLFEANGSLNYILNDHITLKSTAGIRHNKVVAERFYNSRTTQGRTNITNSNGVNGSILTTNQNYFSNSNTINYEKTFNKDHTIKGLGLFELNSISLSLNGYSGRNLPNEVLGMEGLDQGTIYNPRISSSLQTMVSYGSRWDYSYKSKYIVTAAIRIDGSSKFNNKWGYFPAGAVAWNMHKEGFFAKALPFVSTSKLRMSYGSNGNNRVGDFAKNAQLQQTLDGYSFNNGMPVGQVNISNVGNRDLRWEKATIMDLGLELGVLKDRFTMELGLYRKINDDLLLDAELPPTTGFARANKNVGKLQNDGIEITLNGDIIRSEHFTWQSNFNISFNKNKIMELEVGKRALFTNASYVSQFSKPLYMAEIGRPAGMMIGYIWEGNYQYSDFDETAPGVYVLKPTVASSQGNRTTAVTPGEIKYRDLNGDGIMTEADMTFIGRGQPIHTGGFSNNFNYKGFGLNVFFQWSYGNDLYNANRLLLEGNSNGYALINQFASYANRWSPENQTNANYKTRGQGPIGFHSSRVVEDGSYLRLKTLSLNYSIPAKYLRSLYLSSLTLNLAAQNLITWTKYTGMDPEVSTRNSILTPGYDYSSYPQARTIVFGLKASF